jgi:hypothetical protein
MVTKWLNLKRLLSSCIPLLLSCSVHSFLALIGNWLSFSFVMIIAGIALSV